MDENTHSNNQATSTVANVPAIIKSGVIFKTRDEIAKYVEVPLVRACEYLWDINIRTLQSSANLKDLENGAYILIDYNSLSLENKEIAKLTSAKIEDYYGHPSLNFTIPITKDTTIEEISNKALDFVKMFKKQRAKWVPTYTFEQLCATFHIDPNSKEIERNHFTHSGYYYDNLNKIYYLSEEHFKKVKGYGF